VTQGKGTTAGNMSSSMKKTDSPAARKKLAAPAADSGDADSPVAAAPKPKPALGGGPKGAGGPKIYTCYMCGQGFSGSSLGIHQPKCQQKWLAEQAACRWCRALSFPLICYILSFIVKIQWQQENDRHRCHQAAEPGKCMRRFMPGQVIPQ